MLKAEIIFRNATAGEEEKIALLTAETFRVAWLEEGNEEDLEEYIAEYFNVEKISSELMDKNILYVVAEINKEFAGYCKLEKNHSPEDLKPEEGIYISRLYVKKSFQNLQLGSKLMDEVLHIASAEKFKTIWLGVWNENYSAMRFYERFGFRKFGEYKFVMGKQVSDDYLMKRPV